MKRIYTSIGRFQYPTEGKCLCPSIRLGDKEYLLDPQELIIWAALNWRFARFEEIGEYYDKEAANTGYSNDRSWEACLDRLITRGLIMCGSGETDFDALYDLVSPLYIIPLSGSLTVRLFSFMKLFMRHHIPFSTARKILRKDKKTKKEKHIISLTKQALLSVGELIRCVDKGICKLKGNDSVMDAVYCDTQTTSDNIGTTVKYVLCSQDVTVTVANLYLRRQILFERV